MHRVIAVYPSYHGLSPVQKHAFEMALSTHFHNSIKEKCVICNIRTSILYVYGSLLSSEDRENVLCSKCRLCSFVLDHHNIKECEDCTNANYECSQTFALSDIQATLCLRSKGKCQTFHPLPFPDCILCNLSKDLLHKYKAFFKVNFKILCPSCNELFFMVCNHSYATCQTCRGLSFERRQVFNLRTLHCQGHAFCASYAEIVVTKFGKEGIKYINQLPQQKPRYFKPVLFPILEE